MPAAEGRRQISRRAVIVSKGQRSNSTWHPEPIRKRQVRIEQAKLRLENTLRKFC